MAQKETEHFRKNLAVLCSEYGDIQNTADKAGISRVYLSNVIRSKSVPTLDVALKIAKAVGFSLSDLFIPPKEFARNFTSVVDDS